jgi:hypothetical protein
MMAPTSARLAGADLQRTASTRARTRDCTPGAASMTTSSRLDGTSDVDISRHVELAKRCYRAILGDDLAGTCVPDAMERPPGKCGGGGDAAEDEKGQGGAEHEGISREASMRLDAANPRGGFTRKLAR